jgi:hypothetical protein
LRQRSRPYPRTHTHTHTLSPWHTGHVRRGWWGGAHDCGSAVGKAAVGAGGLEALADEARAVSRRDPVDRVALYHSRGGAVEAAPSWRGRAEERTGGTEHGRGRPLQARYARQQQGQQTLPGGEGRRCGQDPCATRPRQW